jgi:hypothetical protein
MPKSNSALNKFDKEPAGSIERKQFQELVSNEFNDARSQVIKRLFEQSATYAELFDKQRTLGNTVVAFSLGKDLGAFKDSIERAKVKLEENEKRPFNDVLGAYSKVISSINSYINSTGARAGEVAGLVGEIRNLAPAINDLFIDGIRKQNERIDKEGDEKGTITDNDLINIFLLFEKIQSGYAEGQQLQGINLAGVVSASEAEKARLKEHLRISKQMTNKGIALVAPGTGAKVNPPPITPFISVSVNDLTERQAEEFARKEQKKAEQIATQQKISAEVARTTPEYLEWQQKFLEKNALRLPTELRDRQDPDFFTVPAKVDGEFVAPPKRPNREGSIVFPSPLGREGIDFNVPPPPPYSPLGFGSARGGRKGLNSEMARTYELIHRYSGFPYFVPPSAPRSKMVNPRSRVNVNTEGSGRKKGKKSGKPKYTDI